MKMSSPSVILIITAITTALMAGLFFAWSCSVIPGLLRVDDHTYVSTMQSINRAIQNPIFLLCFMGAVVLLPLSTFLHRDEANTFKFWCLLSASAFYIAGVFGVTVIGNVPMNDSLDNFNLSSASAQEIADVRLKFEIPWNKLNMIRAVSGVLSITMLIIGMVFQRD